MRTQWKTLYAPLSQWILVGLFALLGLAPAAQGAVATNTLKGMDVTTLPGQKTQIRLTFAKAAPQGIHQFKMKNPDRLVFDFPGVKSKLQNSIQAIPSGAAMNVVAIQGEGRVRVLVNLYRSIAFTTQEKGNVYAITLASAGPAKVAPAPLATRLKKLNPLARHSKTITKVDFRKVKGEGRLVVEMNNSNITVDLKRQGSRLIARFMGAGITPSLLRTYDVTDFDTPAREVRVTKKGNAVVMVMTMGSGFDHMAYQLNKKFVVTIKSPHSQRVGGKSLHKPAKFKGERLSMNFQDIKIRSVLQLIADFTGLNMVAADSVTGSVTLRLKNVPWDQALDIILKSHGLARRRTGNVILVAPATEIADIEQQELKARKEVERLEPLRSELVQVNYANAETLSALLKNQETNLLSKRGHVNVDKRTNTLWVRDTPRHIEELRRLVHQLDIPVRQVLIEARIVAVDTDFSHELGIQWGISDNSHVSGTLNGADDIAQAGSVTAAAVSDRLNFNIPAAATGKFSAGLALAKLGSDLFLDLEISALETEGHGKTISSPRVVTANQQAAYIEQGEEIPYQQATSSGATSVAFKKAVLSLTATPQITPDNKVLLTLKVSQDSRSTEPEVLGVPAIATREVETQVLVNDGETLVLGGVYEQNKTNNVDRVPFFGELPLIGNLFKHTKIVNKRSELLVFVTPRIIKEALGGTYVDLKGAPVNYK